MNNLNSVLVEGTLVQKPDFRFTAKGFSVCNFTIASNRFYHNGEDLEKEVNFLDVETWGKLAEPCRIKEKGQGVRVVGRLKQDRWLGQDGKNHSKISIVAEHVEFKPIFKKAEQEEELLAE